MATTLSRFSTGLPIADLLGDDVPVDVKNPSTGKPSRETSLPKVSLPIEVTFDFATPTVDVTRIAKFNNVPPPHLTQSVVDMEIFTEPSKLVNIKSARNAVATINIFYERVMESCLYAVPLIGSERTLANLTQSIFEFFAVLPENQLVTVMHSNDVVTYAIRLISETTAASVVIPKGACVILGIQPAGRANLVLRRSWPAASTLRKKRPIDADDEFMQDAVRERMTQMLSQKGKGVNLQIISELSQFSKAALSQWRRNQYKGNTQAIAIAVHEALDEIDGCRDKFGFPGMSQQDSVLKTGPSTKRARIDANGRPASINSWLSASPASTSSPVPSDGDEEDWSLSESEAINTMVEGMVLVEMMADGKRIN
jgi:hypothetical protein